MACSACSHRVIAACPCVNSCMATHKVMQGHARITAWLRIKNEKTGGMPPVALSNPIQKCRDDARVDEVNKHGTNDRYYQEGFY